MRVAVWHNLPSGGGKRALFYHVRGLVERGHTVESWCPPTADQSYLPLDELVPEHIVSLKAQEPIGASRVAGLLALYRGPTEAIRALDEHCRQCAEEINRGAFDILFANTCMFLQVASIGRYVRMPKVLYLQEPNRPFYEALPRLRWIGSSPNGKSWWRPISIKRKILDWINLEALRLQAREELTNAQGYDAILANSLFSRESIARAYGLSAEVCYLGVDSSLFRPLGKEREHFVVGVGAFLSSKGIELAIRSVSLLGSPRPPLVWIANFGEQNYIDEMKSLAQALQVDFQVRMRVSDGELVDILNRAALMIYTSRLEPFGFAPLEAGACATPVVALAEGGVRETVKDGLNGLLVRDEPKCVAEAMERLLTDPERARLYGEQGLDYVRREWGLERSIEQLENCLFKYAGAGTARMPALARA